MIRKGLRDGLTAFCFGFTTYVILGWSILGREVDIEIAIYASLAVAIGVFLGSIWRASAEPRPELTNG